MTVLTAVTSASGLPHHENDTVGNPKYVVPVDRIAS